MVGLLDFIGDDDEPAGLLGSRVSSPWTDGLSNGTRLAEPAPWFTSEWAPDALRRGAAELQAQNAVLPESLRWLNPAPNAPSVPLYALPGLPRLGETAATRDRLADAPESRLHWHSLPIEHAPGTLRDAAIGLDMLRTHFANAASGTAPAPDTMWTPADPNLAARSDVDSEDIATPRPPTEAFTSGAQASWEPEPPDQRDFKPWAPNQAPTIEGRETGPFDSERSPSGFGFDGPMILAAGGKGPFRPPFSRQQFQELYRRVFPGSKPAQAPQPQQPPEQRKQPPAEQGEPGFGIGGGKAPSAEPAIPRVGTNAPPSHWIPLLEYFQGLLGGKPGEKPSSQPAQEQRSQPPAEQEQSETGVLRLDDSIVPTARRELRAEFEAATQGGHSEPRTIMLGDVTPEGAVRINALLRGSGIDLDVTGFVHVVHPDAAKHAVKEHGDASREVSRGQLPITADDWAAIPDVLASPDRIEYLGQSRRGPERLGYWKQINGTLFYVEEVRTGRRTLAAVTMWKSRAGRRED